MNLQSRLKKVEKQIGFSENDAEFCGCKKQRNVREPGDAPFPETCELCGKPLLIVVVTSREMRGET
jgi:hypothetical protein